MNKWFYQWFLHSAKCLGTKLAALCSQSWGKRLQVLAKLWLLVKCCQGCFWIVQIAIHIFPSAFFKNCITAKLDSINAAASL